jgi:uncharacterized repeat protein (TIGR01451 family)
MGKHEDILNLEVDPSHINTAQSPVIPPNLDSKQKKSSGGKKKLPTKILVIGGMVLLALVTGAVILYFMTRGVQKEDVEFQFSGPDTVESGQDVTFEIGYANNNARVTMQDTELTLTPPKGFEFISSSLTPSDQANLKWSLGEVSPKSQQLLTIHAKFYGDLNANVALKGTLTFTPSSLGEKLTAEATYAPAISSPKITLDLTAPDTLDAGSQVTYELEVTNNENSNYDNALIKFVLPKGFSTLDTTSSTIANADAPKYDKESDTWKLGVLASGQKKTITLKGRLDGVNGEQEDLVAQLLLAKDGINYIQEEASRVTVISSPSISIQQETSLSTASAGQEIRFLFTIKNTGNSPLTNLTLTDTLDSKAIDPASIRIDSNGVYKNSSVVWDNTVVSSLKLLNPNEEFKIGFSLSPYSTITTAGKEFSIVSAPKIATGSQEVAGETATVKIKTAFDITVANSPFDSKGNPLGSGPTTPTVGQTTLYRLSFTITNKYNTLENAKLVCNIPLGSTYVGNAKTTPGTMVFDSTLKNAVWTIGTMNPNNNTKDLSVATGTFDLSVTPSAPNKGEEMVLAQKCVLSGRDTFINQDVTIPLKDFITEKVQ